MHDLTRGSIQKQLTGLAISIGIGLTVQSLYVLVDLYFVAKLGQSAIAGVGAASNIGLLVAALTQVLSAGAGALVGQAAGGKNIAEVRALSRQAILLGAGFGLLTFIVLAVSIPAYMRSVSAGAESASAGIQYLYWFLPGLALQFSMVAIGAALRGMGHANPSMIVQLLTVAINIVLAPVLILGWGTGYALGVSGAGLASTLSIAIGAVVLGVYFARMSKDLKAKNSGESIGVTQSNSGAWRRMLAIGLPAGGEFLILFLLSAVTYWAISDFGTEAQAGYGVGYRVIQALLLPGMAIAFAASPIAAQSFGAGNLDRVRATFTVGLIGCISVMIGITAISVVGGESLIRIFVSDHKVVAQGTTYLQIVGWVFAAQGISFLCGSMFQALGNTLPALASAVLRFVTFGSAVLWFKSHESFHIEQLWYVTGAANVLQAVVGLSLLKRHIRDAAPQPLAVPTAVGL